MSINLKDLSNEDASTVLLDELKQLYQAETITLKAPSRVFSELQAELSSEEPSINKIVALIKVDQDIEAQLLKIANSVLYSSMTQTTSIRLALLRVGFNDFKRLLLTDTIRRIYTQTDSGIRPLVRRLWNDALRTAELAEALAKSSMHSALSSGMAYAAGLVLNIGILYSLVSIEKLISSKRIQSLPEESVLWSCIGFAHRERGEVLLQEWKFEPFYLTALKYAGRDESLYSSHIHDPATLDVLRIFRLIDNLGVKHETQQLMLDHLKNNIDVLKLGIPDIVLEATVEKEHFKPEKVEV